MVSWRKAEQSLKNDIYEGKCMNETCITIVGNSFNLVVCHPRPWMGNNQVKAYLFGPRWLLCLCLGSYICLSLPDEKTVQRMSFSICQLNNALEHALLMQLICVYLEIAVWQQGRRVGVGGWLLYLFYRLADSAAERGRLWWTGAD